MASIGPAVPSTQPFDDLARRRLNIIVILGTVTSAVNFLDRSVLNILAEPIKVDLGLTDTQLGILTGFAFALFYSLMGIPIARYVDRPRTDRPAVIGMCVALWSAMTVVCGLTANFVQLLIARMFVAVGESGSGPAILTLINHYVPQSLRTRTFAIYGLGVPIGTLLGLVLGGVLVDLIGWRWTFIAVGAPGLVLAVAVKIFMHEPRKDAGSENTTKTASKNPSIVDNVSLILRSSALLLILIASSLGVIVAVGLPSWTGVYLIRILGLSPTATGLILGLTFGVAGGLGTYLGGVVADRISTEDPGKTLYVPALGLVIGIPAAFIAFASSDWIIFAAFYWIVVLGASAYIGPVFSLLQLLVPSYHRATTTVIVIMFWNLIGAGLGPFLVGFGSDLLRDSLGQDSLRWALVLGHLSAILPAVLYLLAAKKVKASVETAT